MEEVVIDKVVGTEKRQLFFFRETMPEASARRDECIGATQKLEVCIQVPNLPTWETSLFVCLRTADLHQKAVRGGSISQVEPPPGRVLHIAHIGCHI